LISLNMWWLAILGDIGYQILLRLNYPISLFQRMFNLRKWSLSQYIKTNTKLIVSIVSNFEKSTIKLASDNGYTGIICGHSHCPGYKIISGVEYWNIGDMVESNTCIVEDIDGKLDIIYVG